MLTKKEIRTAFKTEEINQIIEEHSKETINKIFKEILKKRYTIKWDFLTSNWNEILPIDIQFFFNKNIEPKLIYS